jgi:hypothetical protein
MTTEVKIIPAEGGGNAFHVTVSEDGEDILFLDVGAGGCEDENGNAAVGILIWKPEVDEALLELDIRKVVDDPDDDNLYEVEVYEGSPELEPKFSYIFGARL